MTMAPPETAPRVSIVLVTWNCVDDLRRCLTAIAASNVDDVEVIVVDNASVDGTREHVLRAYPDVHLIENDRNLGHSKGVNQGLRAAEGDYVLVLDADAELMPGALHSLTEFLSSHPDVGIVAPQMLNTDGSAQHTSRAFPSAINGLFGRHSALTRLFPNNPWARRYLMTEAAQGDSPYPVEQVSAACMMFPRSLVAEVGLWDEGYFAYWVDTAWCWHVGRQGRSIFCVPAARVIHHENNRPGRPRSLLRIWLFHAGALRFYRTTRRFGWLDPRVWIALVGLSIRAGIQLIESWLLRLHMARSRRASATTDSTPQC